METLWKVVEALIDTRLHASLHTHNVLHGFRSGRGTGTAVTELKIARELASIYQDPLFLLFMDLRKDYNTVDWDCLIITLEGYGAGPRMCGLLETFWECQQAVPRQNGFHRLASPDTRGMTQGGIVYQKLFNVVVDNVIRTWLAMMVEDQRVAHEGLGETVGQCLGVFYANYGMVGSRDSDWLKHAMKFLVGLFRRYGLAANAAKSCTMIFQTGSLWAGMPEEAMELKCTGVGDSYRVRLQRRIPCPECRVELTAGSMTAHYCRMHSTNPAID